MRIVRLGRNGSDVSEMGLGCMGEMGLGCMGEDSLATGNGSSQIQILFCGQRPKAQEHFLQPELS